MHGDTMTERLLIAFPPSVVEGSVAPHDCPECLSLREHLSGRTWCEVSPEFVRYHPDVLPLLSRNAYRAIFRHGCTRRSSIPTGRWRSAC